MGYIARITATSNSRIIISPSIHQFIVLFSSTSIPSFHKYQMSRKTNILHISISIQSKPIKLHKISVTFHMSGFLVIEAILFNLNQLNIIMTMYITIQPYDLYNNTSIVQGFRRLM